MNILYILLIVTGIILTIILLALFAPVAENGPKPKEDKIEIVKFKNNKYGIRKTSFSGKVSFASAIIYEGNDQDFIKNGGFSFCWDDPHDYRFERHVHGTLEQVEHKMKYITGELKFTVKESDYGEAI